MKKKWIKINILTIVTLVCMGLLPLYAEQDGSNIEHLDEMVVKGQAGAPGFKQNPSQTIIQVDKLTPIGPPNSVIDVVKTLAIIDFRGQSDLDPGVDSIYMRGYDASRFVMSIDGLTTQKTGGRKSSNIVDYALLPTFLIDSVEISPGPHSALYDAKSIGGVLNMKTKSPEFHETKKPDLILTSAFSSYDTFNTTAVIQGGVDSFTYDLAYRNYMTNGYLRNNETQINTGYGRLGLILSEDGYVTVSLSSSDIDRDAPVNNPGTAQAGGIDYDFSYPVASTSTWDPWQNPTWDSISQSYQLNYAQSFAIGRLQVSAGYGTETRDRAYLDWINSADHSQGTYLSSMETDWWQQGGKVSDEIKWGKNQTTTIGCDLAQLYDEGVDETKTERVRKQGAFIQHQWQILPSVDLKLGMRYENTNIWVSNWSNGNPWNTAYDKYVEREWDQWIPKSFATWRLDDLAPWLQNTSLSAGVSRIWHAPDYHGDYNPQGRPAGIFLEPEHGMGYDLILDRGLWRDIHLKVDYAFYQIKDYIATNSTYANYSGAGAGALRFSDYKINLDEVYRHGVDIEVGGHLTDELSFYLTLAWQKFENQGNESAGETELDQRAERRASAGLRYAFGENTTLMVDYIYQSPETTEISDEIAPDVWNFTTVENDAYHVFDFGVQHVFFKQAGWLKNGTLSVYVKNILDEKYYDASGYPATDRTFGASFSISI
ncbi:MAG: TonB-dependent receptor [Pseudomonadota bacterium]